MARSRLSDIALVVALAGAGVCLLAFVTRTGLVVVKDSVWYLRGAEALADGHGYAAVTADGARHAIVNYPPLYSLILAGPQAVGLDLLDASRVVNFVFFGATAALLYATLLRTSENSRLAACLGTVAFVVAPTTLLRFGFAVSEPIFFLLLVATVWLLDEYLRHRSRLAFVAAVGTAGAACVTRNVGVALVVAGVATLAWLGFGDRTARARVAALFGTLAIAPFLAWTAWTASQPEPTARALGVHIEFQRLQNGYGVMAQWLLPEPIPSVVRVPVFGVLLVASIVLMARALRVAPKIGSVASLQSLPPGAVLALCFSVVYAVVIVVTMWFLDTHTRADPRILSPLFVSALLFIPALAARASGRARTTLAVGACVIVGLYAFTTIQHALADPIRNGYPRLERLVGVTSQGS